MASVTFEHVAKVYDGGVRAVSDLNLDIADGEFMVLVGPVRVRQDHRAAHARGARDDLGGRGPHRRARRQLRAVARSRHRDGVPELRALPAPERVREHRVRTARQEGAEARDRPAGAGRRADARARGAARPQAARALRRPAPARRDGPRDRAAPAGVPDGRAALEPRREAARADARRDRAPPAGARGHDDLRDARPGRGDDDGRSRRGHAARRAAAGRPDAGAVRPARSTCSWRASSAARR